MKIFESDLQNSSAHFQPPPRRGIRIGKPASELFPEKEKIIIEKDLSKRLLATAEEDGQTVLHMTYVSKSCFLNGGWVNIYPTAVLIDKETKSELNLLHAINVPLAPERHYFNKPYETLRFTLLFPWMPKSWSAFEFVEKNAQNGFRISNIKRNDSGIYTLNIS